MKLVIQSIHNRGDQDKEYVSLKVEADAKAWSHILTDTTYTDSGKVSCLLRHLYWIPGAVSKGDFIHIYSKSGKDTSFKNKADTTTHEFYWGLKKPVWNDDGDCAVIIEIAEWDHKGVK